MVSTAKGAVAGIVTGAVVTILFKYVLAPLGGFWSIYEIIPGFVLSLIAVLLFSKLDKPTDEMLAEFEEMKRQIKEKDDEQSQKASA